MPCSQRAQTTFPNFPHKNLWETEAVIDINCGINVINIHICRV